MKITSIKKMQPWTEEEILDEASAWLTHIPEEIQHLFESSIDIARKLRAEKDGAYSERNKVVAALAKMFPSGILQDAENVGWWILFIDLPTGQASWHFQESELHLLSGIPKYEGVWDGHSTKEKYQRLDAFRPEYLKMP